MLNKNEEFGALFNNSAIGIISVNQLGEIILVNQYALKQFGYKEKELIGKKIEFLVPKRYMEKHQQHRSNFHKYSAYSRPMGIGMELFGLKKNGLEFPVEVSLSSYQVDGEQYAISFISDITIRKKSEEDLRRLNIELEGKVNERTLSLSETVLALGKQIKAAEVKDGLLQKAFEKEKDLSELKSRFVTMASHEFRTPLSTILSSAYLVCKYEDKGDQYKRVKHIDRIVSSVNMLNDTLNGFLSLGKIDEGKVQVRISEFNIRELIHSFISEMSSILKKGQIITYTNKGNENVKLDPNLLIHILMNLVSNAIKFSSENDEILINTINNNKGFTLSVKDNGMGISEEDQLHLFERFYRGLNVINIQGTGLGLHIVNKYAELMNGTITHTSELNKGTQFTITFKYP